MQQQCSQCSAQFTITDEDLALLDKCSPEIGGKKYSLPPPKMCFDCRLQRRLCFHNEQHLYKRKCDFSGAEIVSMYKPDALVTVYDTDVWYSDKWDPLSYGREYDFGRPFFDQYKDLFFAMPHLALSVIKEYNQNSEFTNNNWKLKNCYLVTDAEECENCYYSKGVEFDRDCMDTLNVFHSELCYECIHCFKCYSIRYSRYCENCSDSWFLRDCSGCKHCFGCCNLHQKQYCIYNEQKTKDEYEVFLQHFESQKYSAVTKAKDQADTFFLTQPVRATRGVQNLNVEGDTISNSKDAYHCFDAADLQDCRYMTRCTGGAKDSQNIHIWGSGGTELCSDGIVIGSGAQRVLFSNFIVERCQNILYSMYCTRGCSDLFGCFSLQKKKYCILNTQYSKEDYEKIVPKIIAHMQETEEWGEYFPPTLSPFGYNETDAQLYYPLQKTEADEIGFYWNTYEPQLQTSKSIETSQLPDDTNVIPDDILNWTLICDKTGKPFKLIEQELQYYKNHQLPIPHRHPQQRNHDRFAYKNPYKLWKRMCGKCNKETLTSYAPERPEIVWCEFCYLSEVY